jgi:hypothetical protein
MNARRTREIWRAVLALALALGLAAACSVPHFEFEPEKATERCKDGVCPDGCLGDSDCPAGWLCCNGACDNVAASATNCGACGAGCESPYVCENAQCSAADCDTGYAECDGDTSHTCETDIKSDPKNCGACQQDCGADLCSGGHCTKMDCDEGSADCDEKPETGCEVNLTDVANCTMCGAVCSSVHGTPGCDADGCSIACDEGFGDCDARVSTGCETPLAEDAANCGACGATCKNENGATTCHEGKCVPLCATGYLDCDGKPENGCETEVATSLTDCGACGATCALEHAGEKCDAGVCKVTTCDSGFDNCDGDAKNGCEADLTSPATCGSCTSKCSDNGGKASCSAGKCGIVCDTGRDDCKNGLTDGCETDLNVSVLNCGGCGKVCPAGGGTPACNDGKCGVSSCTAPLEDCNGDAQVPGGDGCEKNLSLDPANCGGCGNACYYPNASGKCVNKACLLDKCQTGYADCTAAAGCETSLGTTQNCRSCGEACSNLHGSTACTAAGCQPVCALGWDDCDGKPENGCETSLVTAGNCGACGVSCSKAHGSASCATGTCEIASCTAGWDDCDDEATTKNGCETDVYTLTNCGSCGTSCSSPHAAASCPAGQCLQGACDAGYADCGAAAGCETALGSDTDCAACNNACTNAHGTNACGGAPGSFDCAFSCSAGFKSCDNNPDNGCEADLASPASCGNCGVVCSGNTPVCVAGACTNALVNSNSAGLVGTNTKLDFSHTLATAAGRGRLVVVAVASDGSSQPASATSGATYDGKTMTLAKQVWAGSRVTASIYFIKDATLPAPGTYTISISGGEYAKIASAFELRGMDQTNPLEISSGSSGGDCVSDDPSDSLTTATANDFVVTVVGAFGLNSGSPTGTPSAPTENDSNQAGSLGMKSGYVLNAAAGARTVGWDMVSCNPTAQALAAFKPAP